LELRVIALLAPVYCAGPHIDQFPNMAVQVLKPMVVHEAMVLRFVVGAATGVDGFADMSSTFARLSDDRHTSTSVLFVASQICLG
jgi:hypothetical protein